MKKIILILFLTVQIFANNCFYFDGADDGLQVYPQSTITGEPYTVITWVNQTTSANSFVVGMERRYGSPDAYPASYLYLMTNETLYIYTRYSGGNYGTNSIANATRNNWHFVANITAAANSRKSVLNLTFSNTDTNNYPVANFINNYRWGSRGNNTDEITGYIGHTAIWNVALTDNQVKEIYYGTNPLLIVPNNIQLHLYFATLKDRSKNGYTVEAINSTAVSNAAKIKLFYSNGGN